MIHTERTNLLATALNNLGVGSILAGVIVPSINGTVGDVAHIAVWTVLGRRPDLAGANLAWQDDLMDFATYWLIVPLVGIVLTVPAWVWLLWSLRHKHRKSPAE